MSEEPVPAQEEVQEVLEEMNQEAPAEESSQEEVQEEQQVPLTALQKERKKRQELQAEIEYLKQQSQKNQEEDYSQYETATREDLTKSQADTVRVVEERLWMKQNPEKAEKINEELPQFLKQRPHLAQAIAASPNRYEEAYLLMNAFSPREKKVEAPKAQPKPAPGSPSSVPKGAALDQTVDVMNMDDSEFRKWRQSLKRGR